jgi:hypothetical protein
MLEITAGALSRPASVRDLSQYPSWLQFMWSPGAFFEPNGSLAEENIGEGLLIKVLPVRINANSKTVTLEVRMF